jgi:predicted transcriptional regulator
MRDDTEVRDRIAEHVRVHPGLTAYAIARGLELFSPDGTPRSAGVRYHLRRLAEAGRVQLCQTGSSQIWNPADA